MDTIERIFDRLEYYKVINPRPYHVDDDEYGYFDPREHTYCTMIYLGESRDWKNPKFAVKSWRYKDDYLEIGVYNLDVLAGHGSLELRNINDLSKWFILDDNPTVKALYG